MSPERGREAQLPLETSSSMQSSQVGVDVEYSRQALDQALSGCVLIQIHRSEMMGYIAAYSSAANRTWSLHKAAYFYLPIPSFICNNQLCFLALYSHIQ